MTHLEAAQLVARMGLKPDVGGDDFLQAHAMVGAALADARGASVPSTPRSLRRLYQYQVPKLSEDGSCSLHGELDPAPYDLAATLGGSTTETTIGLLTLDSLLELVATQLDVAWLGLYQARRTPRGDLLVKLCAHGTPSRAEFPLTSDFSALSINVAVAFTGRAQVIDEVRAHVKAGGAYYECDPNIRSEACVPVVNASGQVLGVLDAEHTQPGYFIPRRLAWLAALALELDGSLPPGGLLLTPQ